MKPIILFTAVLFSILFSGTAIAQKSTKSEDIKVWGNCGMCKKTIETAATKAGASKASWSEESKVLSVTFNEKKTDATKIQEAVAASGYDTEAVTAPTEAYNKLHGCCQYERKSATASTEKKATCGSDCTHKADCSKGEEICKAAGCCKK